MDEDVGEATQFDTVFDEGALLALDANAVSCYSDSASVVEYEKIRTRTEFHTSNSYSNSNLEPNPNRISNVEPMFGFEIQTFESRSVGLNRRFKNYSFESTLQNSKIRQHWDPLNITLLFW